MGEPSEVERLARLICEEQGNDPDALAPAAWGMGDPGHPWPLVRWQMARASELLRQPSDAERRALARLHEETRT